VGVVEEEVEEVERGRERREKRGEKRRMGQEECTR
jgi:hypothetical protein